MNEDTLPNGTTWESPAAHNEIIASDATHYTVRATYYSQGGVKVSTVLRKYVHEWHGDYLAKGLHTRGGEATGRKSRPVRIVPY
jgi:hypothetical protein